MTMSRLYWHQHYNRDSKGIAGWHESELRSSGFKLDAGVGRYRYPGVFETLFVNYALYR